jgi:hypothetical protein
MVQEFHFILLQTIELRRLEIYDDQNVSFDVHVYAEGETHDQFLKHLVNFTFIACVQGSRVAYSNASK